MNRYDQMAVVRRKWTAPPELGHSTPRAVRFTKGGIALAVCVAAMAVFAVVFAVLAGRESTRQTGEGRRLVQQGQDVDARIVRLWRTSGEGKHNRVEYWFRVDGRTYQREMKVPRRIWKTLTEGGTLPVRFLPANPDVNHPRPWKKGAMSVWIAILVPAGIIAGALFAVWGLRRQMGLLAEGRPALAVVTKVRTMQHQHGKSTMVDYEFPMLSGGIGKGKTEWGAKGVGPGTTLTILYDPNNPGRNVRYPMSLVRVDRS